MLVYYLLNFGAPKAEPIVLYKHL